MAKCGSYSFGRRSAQNRRKGDGDKESAKPLRNPVVAGVAVLVWQHHALVVGGRLPAGRPNPHTVFAHLARVS